MKLFRSHSRKFQKEIEEGQFVTDFSRKFNTTDERGKNWGQLYFYAPSIEGAMSYSEEGRNPVFEYEFSGNLLDLRVKENRAMLTGYISSLVKEEEERRKSMLSFYTGKNIHPSVFIPLKEEMTEERVINDDRLDSLSYWGQRCTDFQFGEIMRSELERLGYDGIIFFESNSVDIALLNPAEFIGEVEIREVA